MEGHGTRMNYAAARRNMVDSQIRTNKVSDQAILDALAAVPRERFVPDALKNVAYVDEDIPLGGGRFLIEPMILARLLQAASIGPSDAVLVVGAGPGYSAAVAARLAARVVAVESDRSLAGRASQLMRELGVANVAIVEGALNAGAPRSAPYDAVMFDGAVEVLPQAITDQLAEDGRLVAVVNNAGIGRATLMKRKGGVLSSRIEFDAAIPLLPGFEAPSAFVF